MSTETDLRAPTETDLLAPADPNVRIYATYGASLRTPQPLNVSVEVLAGPDTVVAAIYAAVDAVARVPASAQHANDTTVR